MNLPLHNSSNAISSNSIKRRIQHCKVQAVVIAVAALSPIFIPFFHIGILSHLWDEYNVNVDQRACTCSCWDTVFKGPYDRGPGRYKHVYFNATSNTLNIWAVTIIAILLLYETVKRFLKLIFERQVRISMGVLLTVSLYPHYYSWWSYFNYWNDDFYDQWNHQLFFSITELLSTIMVVHLLDRKSVVTSRKCLFITSIAIIHIACSGFDQFVYNVVRGNGMMHQVLRDIFFMVPDTLHVLLPFLELHRLAKQLKVPISHTISDSEFFVTIAFIAFSWVTFLLLR